MLGSCLVLSCSKNLFWQAPMSGTWQVKLAHQLELATKDLYRWKKAAKVSCSFKRFKVTQLHIKRRNVDWPWLKSKAANAAAITSFLLHLYSRLPHPDEEDKMVKLALTGFDRIYQIVRHKHRWLSKRDRKRFEEGRQMCLHAYNALSAENAARDPPRALFNMLPKFHMTDHIIRDAVSDGMNPRCFWTLGDESFGGDVAKVCAVLHPRAMSQRCVNRWMAVFFKRPMIFEPNFVSDYV